jgi:RNA-directed DNA polymerase
MNLIERIQKDFSLSLHDVHVLVFTASRRYKLHYIEKRHGRGKRLIAQPTAEIKMLQRWAVEKYLHLLPIHKVATAYRPRVSIKDHAAVHAANRYLLKLDFQDFFPSISGAHFLMHLKSHMKISDDDANLLIQAHQLYLMRSCMTLTVPWPIIAGIMKLFTRDMQTIWRCRLVSQRH